MVTASSSVQNVARITKFPIITTLEQIGYSQCSQRKKITMGGDDIFIIVYLVVGILLLGYLIYISFKEY